MKGGEKEGREERERGEEREKRALADRIVGNPLKHSYIAPNSSPGPCKCLGILLLSLALCVSVRLWFGEIYVRRLALKKSLLLFPSSTTVFCRKVEEVRGEHSTPAANSRNALRWIEK